MSFFGVRYRWGGFFLGVALFSCRAERNFEERAELERLGIKLRALREAGVLEKRVPLARLREERCAAHCELRDECIVAYEMFASVQDRLLATKILGPSSEVLDRLTRELAQAQQKIEGCIGREFRASGSP